MALIVSLTTIKSRLDIAYVVIYSLLKQDLKPDKIYIWISKEKYLLDEGIEEIPEWYQQVDNNIVIIRWTSNIGPYRKLNPLYLEMNDDDIVVTADDDMYYGRKWLKNMVECSENNPDDVIAGIIRIPTRNLIGKFKSYDVWPKCNDAIKLLNAIPIGAGGVLYKKHFFAPEVMQSDACFKKYPVNDDIWYRYATAKNNICVTVQSSISNEIYEINTPDSLWDNFNNNENKIKGHKKNLFLRLALRMVKKIDYYFRISKSQNDKAFNDILSFLFRK